MTHRHCLPLLLVLSLTTSAIAADVERPNIVLVLVDDLGWADLPCYGNKFHETPTVDRLAREGMRFTDFYASGAVCSPTRAGIQSGQYQARFGLTAHIPGHWRPFEKLTEPPNAPHMPREIVTVAEALKTADYATGYFGKWHLGPVSDGSKPSFGPLDQGYDTAVVTSGRHFAPRFTTTPKTQVADGAYLADFLTEQTCQFIEQHRDEPFFVQLSHYAVHIPLEAKAEAVRHYREKPKPATGVNHPVYAAMVQHVDQSLARILNKLDALKLADRTVVVFTSDNGGLNQTAGGGESVTTNAPLRDEKGTLYEGGIRVPLIVRYPGVVKAGTVCRTPTISLDFYPTFLELAAARHPEQPVDGVSLLPLLKQAGDPEREALYFHFPHYHHSRPAGVIRAGKWKLIEFFDDQSVELYNLESDLSETKNLAAAETGLAARLQARLHDWRKSVGARMPAPNPKYDPQRAGEWWNRKTGKPK